MSSARAIINEAVNPKRVLRQVRQGQAVTLTQLLNDGGFKKTSPTQFYYPIQPVAGLVGKIWVTAYTSSVWYRCALLRGATSGSPVFKVWETNPPRHIDQTGESSDDELVVPVLARLTDEIKRALASPPGESQFRQRQWLTSQIDQAFQEADRTLRALDRESRRSRG